MQKVRYNLKIHWRWWRKFTCSL